MNYNNKHNQKLEMDEMNIKSHLNNSLDLSGIRVSEDLINRTLAAIKEQSVESKESQTSSDQNSKNIIPWNRYVRGFAGIAAAAIIVVLGYNVVSQFPINSKMKEAAEDSASPESNSILMEKALDESMVAATAENGEEADLAEDSVVDYASKEDVKFTITAETFADNTASVEEPKAAGEGALEDGGGTSARIGASETEEKTAMENETNFDIATDEDTGTLKFETALRSSETAIVYTFRDIFLPSPEQAEYITISDEVNATSITLTKQSEIQAFYTIMDSHQFNGTGTDSMTDPNYTVEMKNPQTQALYTMLVGNNLIVRYTQGDTVVESIYYAVEDSLFKQDLEEFFLEYNK